MKIVKIIGIIILFLIVSGAGVGIYFYQTNPILKAMINNDESKLYYSPITQMQSMEDMNYTETVLKVEDSLDIYTYYFQPSTIEPKANIFFIHAAGGNVSTYKYAINTFLENGFKVYAMDWRGFGNSTGKPNYIGVLKDTEAAFIDFKKKTASDSLKTIVYGMSLGGQLAVKIVKDNQMEVDALVLDGSMQSAQQMAIDYSPMEFIKEKARNNPQDFNQDYVAIRDIEDILNIPKLIIHSRTDPDVSFFQGENLFNAAKNPKEFWMTDTDHIMTLKEYPEETIKRLEKLLK